MPTQFGIEDWLRIIASLSPLVPGQHSALAGKLAGIVGEIIAAEKARSGLTIEEILTKAGLQQDATALLIEAELQRLDKTTAPLPPTE